jgi:hypothetical protein
LRYFIDGDRRPVGITDNGQPTKWALPNLPPDRRTTEDYAIVSRVFHPDTHAMLVEIAGITQYGTDAASDLVTNPDLFADAMLGARRGWEKSRRDAPLVSLPDWPNASGVVVLGHRRRCRILPKASICQRFAVWQSRCI